MSECSASVTSVAWNRRLAWFIGLELLCITSFAVLLAMGRTQWAVAALVVPFQLLLWLALAGSGRATLVAFAALVPLATAALLPTAYQRYVLFPGTIGLLALLLLSRQLFADLPATPRIRSIDRALMLVLSIWTIVSGLQAASRGWGNQPLLLNTLLVVEVVFLIYFAAVIPRSLRDIRVLLYVMLGSMAVVAAWVPAAPLTSGGLEGKIASTPFGSTNFNIVACGLATAGAVSLGLAAGTKSRRPKALLFVLVLLYVAALVVTRSRGGWFGFGVAFLYVLVRSRSKGLLLLGAIAAAGLIASDFLRSMLISRAAETSARDPSMLGRLVLWYFAWRVAKANWLFGAGMDNFRYVKHFYGYPMPFALARQYNAHSLYLEVLADLGVVGFVAFFSLLGRAVGSAWRAVKLDASRNLGLGLGAGFVAVVVHGLVESNMFNPGVFALLGVLIGLSFSLSRLTAHAAALTSSALD